MRVVRTWERYPAEVAWVEQFVERYVEALYPSGLHRVERYYSPEWMVGWFTGLAWWESRGNPDAVNTRVYSDPWQQAAGLFQHKPRYWSALSLDAEGVPRGTPGRVESAIAALDKAGLDEPWMSKAHVLEPLPGEPGKGILHAKANTATAVRLFVFQGPGAWAPSRSLWRPEWYDPETTVWYPEERTWGRVSREGFQVT